MCFWSEAKTPVQYIRGHYSDEVICVYVRVRGWVYEQLKVSVHLTPPTTNRGDCDLVRTVVVMS